MKYLLTLATLLASASSFAGTFQCTSEANASTGETYSFTYRSDDVGFDLDRSNSTEFRSRVYIMNDSIPGQYYFEGLLRTPEKELMVDNSGNPIYTIEPRWFKMKFSEDNLTAKLVHMKPDASDKVTIQFKTCRISRD